MPLPYPMQAFGRYKLGLALTYKLIHDRFGFDLGERYHLDSDHRIRTTMEIDRAVFDTYGRIGLGFDRPCPRIVWRSFGHRFMPVMYAVRVSRDISRKAPCGATEVPTRLHDKNNGRA